MKRISVFILVMLLVSNPVFAFLYEVETIGIEEIKKLSNEEMLAVYIDAKIETNASQTFHINAGFSNPKEYKRYKDLLKFIVRLRQEMEARNVDAPPIDEWLK